MATISEVLAIAIQHHQGGRLQAAEQIYRQILAVEPDNADALHLLGVIAAQVGQHEFAAQYIGRAIELKDDAAAFHNNLGGTYRALHRIPEAVACYRRALALDPDYVDAHSNLAHALTDQGKLNDAVACHRRALELKPDFAEAHYHIGIIFQGQGNLEEAIACYRRAMKLKPDFTEPHYHLGVIFQGQGKLEEAIACYHRALKRKPDYAEAHNNLGVAANKQGKLEEAIASYRRAVELKPDYAEAHFNLGVALKDQKKLGEAIACYRRAVELKPDFAEAHSNLGASLKDQGKLDEAVGCYRRALELKPNSAEGYNNLGLALADQGNLDEAIASYRRAVELKPDYAEAHGNLGIALKDQGKLEEAVACYRPALELKPDSVEAHNNLGSALREQGKLDEAIACCRRAMELKPDSVEAHNNLGSILRDLGKLDEAIACFRRAVELKPDYAEAHVNLAFVWLLAGDWQEGWPEYEWRLRRKGLTLRRFSQPRWEGGSLAGKTILLHAEQGLGDTIQFIRYAAIVKQHGGTVILECQKPLLRVLEKCPGVDQWIGQGNDLPAFDVHAPLLSVPGILKTSLETIPASIPYLLPESAILDRWLTRLIGFDGFRIGIIWQGSPTYRDDRFRSIPLHCFAPLAEIPGVRLISLQKGAGTEQLSEVRDLFPVMDFSGELDQQSGPFMDTAAVMKNLDLVITSDTAAAHLAGALGVPVWVALPFAPDWRWLLDRSDSPWYPTMRLFRQRERGNWQGVFERISQALREWLPAK